MAGLALGSYSFGRYIDKKKSPLLISTTLMGGTLPVITTFMVKRLPAVGRGNPYENAMVESFIKTLKCEEAYLMDYRSLEDVKESLPIFIEEGHNEERLHPALGYVNPDEFENNLKLASREGYFLGLKVSK